eukprot:TRINITY_DN463_c2_g1_i5.p1 TRINITY_DN463_c2_g1~~TRINITY_DN463_c2_g1_i5.p1  ORF type:complete len:709 (+),score=265.49 TRINITY_DN463_c2_g1_i5:2258-4384(+)
MDIETLSVVCDIVCSCPHITHLSLDWLTLTESSSDLFEQQSLMDIVCARLFVNPRTNTINSKLAISSLSFRANGLQPGDELDKMCDALKQNVTLTSLNLFGNPLGDDGVIQIAQVLKQNKTIVSLSLSNTEMTDKGLNAILQVLTDYQLTEQECNAYRSHKRTMQKLRLDLDEAIENARKKAKMELESGSVDTGNSSSAASVSSAAGNTTRRGSKSLKSKSGNSTSRGPKEKTTDKRRNRKGLAGQSANLVVEPSPEEMRIKQEMAQLELSFTLQFPYLVNNVTEIKTESNTTEYVAKGNRNLVCLQLAQNLLSEGCVQAIMDALQSTAEQCQRVHDARMQKLTESLANANTNTRSSRGNLAIVAEKESLEDSVNAAASERTCAPLSIVSVQGCKGVDVESALQITQTCLQLHQSMEQQELEFSLAQPLSGDQRTALLESIVAKQTQKRLDNFIQQNRAILQPLQPIIIEDDETDEEYDERRVPIFTQTLVEVVDQLLDIKHQQAQKVLTLAIEHLQPSELESLSQFQTPATFETHEPILPVEEEPEPTNDGDNDQQKSDIPHNEWRWLEELIAQSLVVQHARALSMIPPVGVDEEPYVDYEGLDAVPEQILAGIEAHYNAEWTAKLQQQLHSWLEQVSVNNSSNENDDQGTANEDAKSTVSREETDEIFMDGCEMIRSGLKVSILAALNRVPILQSGVVNKLNAMQG